MSDIVIDNGGSTAIVVGGDNGTDAIVGSPTPVDIQVEGALMGPPGPTGSTGATGPQGATGGIVPITVSAVAPVGPNLNDLWIDIS